MESEVVTPADSAHDVAEHKVPNYYLIWVVLGVLTLAEVGIAFVSALPKTLLVIILIAMAIWKAVLVAMYYMHLKFEPRKLWLITLVPFPLALILVMIVLSEKW